MTQQCYGVKVVGEMRGLRNESQKSKVKSQ